MINCDGLVKIYETDDKKVMALEGLDLTVETGEMLAVIGKSGSGKSTLLHLLGGLDRADSGSVEYFGENLLDMNDVQLSDFRLHNIGFIFQAYNLFPELSVYENILLPFRMDHRKGGKKEAQELRAFHHGLTMGSSLCRLAASLRRPSRLMSVTKRSMRARQASSPLAVA